MNPPATSIKLMILSGLILICPMNAGGALAEDWVIRKCGINPNKTLAFVEEKINTSALTSKMQISCDDLSKINGWQEDKITLTTGRKNGRYTICVSDNEENPCEYILSTFNTTGIPAQLLAETFGIESRRKSVLNETVERLFLKPSRLLTR